MGTTVTIKDGQFKGFWQNTSIQEGFKLNKWYHIVGLFNENTNESKLYINGLLINSYPRTDGMPTNLNTTDDVLRIGNELFSNGSNLIHFPGLIDDVRVFNCSLSENEIKLLYHENDYSVLNLNISACNEYVLNDSIYKTSGNYTQNLINHMGGDSLIKLNLIITSIDTSVTLISGEIIAKEQNANYKWLDCENNIIVQDATSNSFTPQESGSYAVIISKNNCIDTSDCKSISITDIDEMDKKYIEIFPNPVDNKLIIQSSEILVKTSIRIQNLTGVLIRNFNFENTRSVELDLNIPSGIYLLIITDNLGRNTIQKLVKQ